GLVPPLLQERVLGQSLVEEALGRGEARRDVGEADPDESPRGGEGEEARRGAEALWRALPEGVGGEAREAPHALPGRRAAPAPRVGAPGDLVGDRDGADAGAGRHLAAGVEDVLAAGLADPHLALDDRDARPLDAGVDGEDGADDRYPAVRRLDVEMVAGRLLG